MNSFKFKPSNEQNCGYCKNKALNKSRNELYISIELKPTFVINYNIYEYLHCIKQGRYKRRISQ
jgi:hypothetical protein